MYRWAAPVPFASVPDHEVYILYHHHFPAGKSSEQTADEIIKVTSFTTSSTCKGLLTDSYEHILPALSHIGSNCLGTGTFSEEKEKEKRERKKKVMHY